MTDTVTISPQSPTIVTAPSPSTTVIASVPATAVVTTPPNPQIVTPAPAVSAVLVVPVAGPTGPAGPVGDGALAYTHTQTTPSTVWDIEHNLGYHPAGIRVEAAGGDTYWPQVTYLTATTVRLNLPESINGTAHLS